MQDQGPHTGGLPEMEIVFDRDDGSFRRGGGNSRPKRNLSQGFSRMAGRVLFEWLFHAPQHCVLSLSDVVYAA